MASTALPLDRTLSIGRVFSRAFGTIGAHPATMFGIAFLFGALPTALLSVATRDRRMAVAGFTPTAFAVGAGALILTLVFTLLAQGALVRATVAHNDGQEVRFKASALAGLRNVVPLCVLGILLGLGVGFALLLLVVPGIILYIVWSVAAPVLVAEQTGIFDAFARSATLTRGARWNIFAIQLVALLIFYAMAAVAGVALVLASGGVEGMVAARQGGPSIINMILSAAFSTVSIAITAAIQTSLYVELRDWKEGPAARALGDIFA